MKNEGCKLCNQKPFSDWGVCKDEYDYTKSTIMVTDPSNWLVGAYIGADADGRIGCIAVGEVESDFYHFNYCPQWGES